MRKAISNAEVNTLIQNITLQNILDGEVKVPEIVELFFQYLVGGPDSRSWKQDGKQRRIRSLSQDAVFAATSGRKIPKEHIQFGLNLKSMTGSRRVIEMANRLDHCASYHTISEIETEMTFQATKEKSSIPYGMNPTNDCGLGVAWDNFDRFVETQSGKDTLHDTIGITYQKIINVQEDVGELERTQLD